MLSRVSRLSAVRKFILAPPACFTIPACSLPPLCGTISLYTPLKHSRRCNSFARFSTASAQKTSIPYALTAAIRTFQEQLKREELDFLPQAYDYVRQVILESQRRDPSPVTADGPLLSRDVVRHAMSLLAVSPKREHAALHLAIFNDLKPILHLNDDFSHPLEFTAQTFQNHVRSDMLDVLPGIYDHLQHLADIVPDPREVFSKESAAWRAVSWMQRLAGERIPLDLLPRILLDLQRLFGLQPTLVHHQLVVKGFVTREQPDEAWSWLRKMEQHEEAVDPAVWLKPNTTHYNLLLKFFATRGDVVSVRMLLAYMTPHATPSQLSYHLYITAILVAGTLSPHRRTRLTDAVEELENAGHTVHLKTLGSLAGRGPLASWVSPDIFGLLRAAQGRGNARSRAMRGKEGLKSEDLGYRLIGATSSFSTSDIKSLGAGSPQESFNFPPDVTLLTDVSQGVGSTRSTLRKVLPENGTSQASTIAAHASEVVADESVVHAISQSPAIARGAPGNIRSEDETEGETSHSGFGEMADTVRRENVESSARATPEPPVVHPHEVKDGTFTDAFEEPPGENRNEVPPSGHLRHETAPPEDLPASSMIAPECGLHHIEPVDNAGQPAQRLDPQSEYNPSNGADIPVFNASDDRVRRRCSRLLYNSLKNGDLREASKIYADFTAVAGPDVEFGGEMIKALCQGRLLQPPPRPHIIQALRIYQSLVEMEKHEGMAKGFFDSADNNSRRRNIGEDIYKVLLRALSAPAPTNSSFRDYGSEVLDEYVTYSTELLTDMDARGFRPDGTALVSILLLCFRTAKTHEEAFDYYKTIVGDRFRSTKSTPADNRDKQTLGSRLALNLTEYRKILDAFIKLGFPEAPIAPAHLWLSIIHDMRTVGVQATVKDYTRFLSRISDPRVTSPTTGNSSIDPDASPKEVAKMTLMYTSVKRMHQNVVLDANISPDAYLLNALLNAYQRLGAFEDALHVFNLIWLSGRMDSVTPVIIFDACGHAGQQNVAYAIWCMLVAKGWKFDKRTLDTWVECLCRTNVEAACRFVCVYMGRENCGYLSDGDTRPDLQTCLILLKLSWLRGQNNEVKEKIKAHLPHIWDELKTRYE